MHHENSAPAEATALTQAKKQLGSIPNLCGVLAESPQALAAYMAVSDQVRKSSLSAAAQQVVLLTASRHNGCSYCVAAYSALAAAAKVDPAVIDAVREDKPIDDPQLEAVHRFLVVDNRGWVADADVKALLDAGFTRRQVLDILTGVAMKTMSNYTNHLARTPPRGLGGVLMDRGSVGALARPDANTGVFVRVSTGGRRYRRSPSTRASRSSTALATWPVRPSFDIYAMSGFGCSGGAEIVGLVVSIVPARAEVHLRGIDTMWRRSFTQRPGRHVVCFVVFIVVALGGVCVLGTEVASGPVLFHVQPPSMGARLAAERSP